MCFSTFLINSNFSVLLVFRKITIFRIFSTIWYFALGYAFCRENTYSFSSKKHILSKKYWHNNRENVNKFKYFCAENEGKTQLPSSTSIGGKKQGFGVPQNLGDLDPQNDRFFVFGNWLKTRKSVEFSVHSTLIMKAKSWILQKHNIKIKLSENQKNTKSLCLDRTQNHRFLVQKCEKWAEIAQLRAGERVGR